MKQGFPLKFLSLAGALVLLLGVFAAPVASQTTARGHLLGTIYDRDATTPIAGAVVKLRNITTGSLYEAPPTDKTGTFRLENLAKGIYNFGITTNAGDFNSNELIGIIENETTKISISLNTYEGQVRQDMQEIAREQSAKDNESRIGRVVQYVPASQEAVVFIEKGALQVDDRIRVRGITTNFYQNVETMGLEGVKVKRALAGQNPYVKIVSEAQTGDSVYLVCKKGVPPFFLTPCGIASVIGGAGLIAAGIITFDNPPPVSAFKK